MYLLCIVEVFWFASFCETKIREAIEHLPQLKSDELAHVGLDLVDVHLLRDKLEACLLARRYY